MGRSYNIGTLLVRMRVWDVACRYLRRNPKGEYWQFFQPDIMHYPSSHDLPERLSGAYIRALIIRTKVSGSFGSHFGILYYTYVGNATG